MNLRKPTVRIPLTFLWALAHGMWMGAGWHALSGTHAPASVSVASCGCAAKTAPDKSISRPAVQQDCAACAVAAMVQDAPAIPTAALVALAPVAEETIAAAESVRSVPIALHPGRGPPVV